MSLHKLAFMVHGIYSAVTDKPLFEGDVVATDTGPSVVAYRDALSTAHSAFTAVSDVFSNYKPFQLPEEAAPIIKFVTETYSHIGDDALRERASNFNCYRNNYVPGAKTVMPFEDIKQSFSRWLEILEEIDRLEKEQY